MSETTNTTEEGNRGLVPGHMTMSEYLPSLPIDRSLPLATVFLPTMGWVRVVLERRGL